MNLADRDRELLVPPTPNHELCVRCGRWWVWEHNCAGQPMGRKTKARLKALKRREEQ